MKRTIKTPKSTALTAKRRAELKAAVLKVIRDRENSKAAKTARGEALTQRGTA